MKEGRGTNPFKHDVGCNTNELDQTTTMKSPLIQIDNSLSSPYQSWDQSSQSLPYSTTSNVTTFSSWSSATDTQENSTWDQTSSPLSKSPWSSHLLSFNNESSSAHDDTAASYNRLMGSLVREEGHIYSLAASGDLLYTGSDSKNIRVWKNQREYSGFKSNSGLVKSIVISSLDCRIFTGHQDGKIRVWRMSSKNPSMHKRIGTLPTLKAYIKNSIKPSNYMERSSSKVNRDTLRIKHFDAISSLSLSEDNNFLYSASWDKTIKVWKVSNFKCLESIPAHEDAVNAVVDGFDGLVFTGSADGTVKVWRRELQGRGTKHFFSQCLLRQECAVTALVVNPKAGIVYCGSSDGVVKFWERDKWGSMGGELRGHKLAVLCMATAGNVVFSGSADMGICVWRKEEAKAARGGVEHVLLSTLTGHSGPVKCLAVEKDGESMINDRNWILYSGSLDKSVKMWRISENAPPDRDAAGSMLTSAGQKQLPHQEQKR